MDSSIVSHIITGNLEITDIKKILWLPNCTRPDTWSKYTVLGHHFLKQIQTCLFLLLFVKTFEEQTKKTYLFDFWARKEQKVIVAEETLIPLTIRTRLTPACCEDCSEDFQYSYFGLDHRACCHFYLTALMEGWGSRMRELLTQVMGLVCSSLRTNWRWCGLSCWLTLLSLWRQDDQELWIQTRNKPIDLMFKQHNE